MLALLTAAGGARALDGQYNPPRPGATFEMLDITYDIVAHDGMVTHAQTREGESAAILAGLHWMPKDRFDAIEGELDRGKLAEVWPLKAGKSIGFTLRHSGADWDYEIAVIGQATISIPAGTFDTFVVRKTLRAERYNYVGRTQIWYAPNLGVPIRWEWRQTEGQQAGATQSGELTRYELAAPE